MNVDEMTAEELMELANKKAGADAPAASTTVDIDGLVVHIDTAKAKGWKAFRIISQVAGEVTPQTMNAMMEFVEYVSDTNEDSIVAHYGGDNASLEDVISAATKIIESCYPKN